MQTFRLKLIAESEDGADIPEEVEEIEDDEPETETLKYANRSGSYFLCSRAGLGLFISRKELFFINCRLFHRSSIEKIWFNTGVFR